MLKYTYHFNASETRTEHYVSISYAQIMKI